jgi:NAD(P)-dependent dehydrogenase (short-subunit alcohol dehydrogenase family)
MIAPGPIDTDLFRAGKADEAKASWVQGQVVQPNGGMV